MNIQKYILSFFILLSTMVFGQGSGTADFSFKVKFKKDIPIEKIEVLYFVKDGSRFNKINYKVNTSNNEIELFGNNYFIIGAGFPTIVFSYKEDKLYKYDNDLSEREIQNLFYLIIKKDRLKNLDKELKFSKEKPNIIVDYKNNKGVINWEVSNYETHFLPMHEMIISNELVKVKPVE